MSIYFIVFIFTNMSQNIVNSDQTCFCFFLHNYITLISLILIINFKSYIFNILKPNIIHSMLRLE